MSLTIAVFVTLNTAVTMLSDFGTSNGHVQLSNRNMYKMLNCKHCRSHHLQVCSRYTCLWNIILEDARILYFMIENFWKLLRTLGASWNWQEEISRIFFVITISQENTVIAFSHTPGIARGSSCATPFFFLHFKQSSTFSTPTLQNFRTIRSASAEMFHVEAQMWCS
jgi:hypothetical protein